MKTYQITALLLILTLVKAFQPIAGKEKPIAIITVDPGETIRVDTPVSVSLDGLAFRAEADLKLQEVKGNKRIDVPVQLENGHTPRLWWFLSGTTNPDENRVFELFEVEKEQTLPAVQATIDETSLKLILNKKELMQYQHAVMPPPKNADTLFARSGFIHPLRTPSGFNLSRIHAPDHIHHMGLWNPWTKTKFEGRQIDFWNLYKGEGTVRFANFSSIISGDVYGGFQAIQNHVDLTAPGGEKTALNEEWDIRLWNNEGTATKNAYLLDFTSTLNCASTSPITFEEYRYAGFGFRATEQWHKDNSTILTSEGKTRLNSDGTNARWCIVSGEAEEGEAGILFMSHPTNYNHPEPMRIWPENANGGRGDVFFQFAPTKDKDWELLPGTDYSLKYRMYVFDGTITAQKAEQIWQDFATPPRIKIEKL